MHHSYNIKGFDSMVQEHHEMLAQLIQIFHNILQMLSKHFFYFKRLIQLSGVSCSEKYDNELSFALYFP